jgi:hypothetical protein
MCVDINGAPSPQAGLIMRLQSRPPLDDESINNPIDTGPPPLVMVDISPMIITTATPNEAQPIRRKTRKLLCPCPPPFCSCEEHPA